MAGDAGPARDIVMLNAGVALYAANVAPTMIDGVALAREALASGAAQIHDEAPGNLVLDFHYGNVDAVKKAFAEAAHAMLQHVAARVRREPGHRRARAMGGGDRGIHCGGIEDKIDSTLPPVFKPNRVPRS